MNGYERMMAALGHKQPDRVPIVCAAVSQNVMDGVLRKGVVYEDFVEEMDSDAILISGQDGYLADWLDEHHFRDEWGVVWKVTDVQIMEELNQRLHPNLKTSELGCEDMTGVPVVD